MLQFRTFTHDVNFQLRQFFFKVLCAIDMIGNFKWTKTIINRKMDENLAMYRATTLAHIGYTYDWAVTDLRLAANVEDDLAIDRMSNASFQLWLEDKFPDLSPGMRTEALERFRAGTL